MHSRRSLFAAPAVLAAAAALPLRPARAKAPLANAATPAVYRFKLGAIEVTAISDGTLDLTPDIFPGAKQDPATASRLLAQAALSDKAVPTFVNAYLVNSGDRLVLVDTGTGPTPGFGPNLGRLAKNLAAAGVDPGAVDLVVATHLHPDHVGGLSPASTPAFPNAELVLAEPEYAFWTNEGMASRAPADFQPFFKLANEAVKPYASRTRRMNAGEVAPGISLEPAPGHTPGHSMVRIASGPAQLLIWGDIVHMAALQFEKPDWSLAFDTDQNEAAETRKRVFDMTASDKLLVSGMHLPFPGLGRVTRRGDAYAFAPEPWQG